MPPNAHVINYTLTDLKVAPIVDEVPGTLIDIPGIRSLEVTVGNDAVELRGDNRVLAVVDQGNGLEWSMEAGGLSLEALETILGGVSTDAGTAEAETRTFDLADTTVRPYFAIVGVTPDDTGVGDLHVVVWKAKATGDFALSMSDQEFVTPTLEGRGIGRASDGKLLTLVQHETAIAAVLPT